MRARGADGFWPGPSFGWKGVLGLGGGAIVLGLLVFLLVDVADAFGLRTALVRASGEEVRLWSHLYENGGPIEWFQWSFLAATGLLAAAASARQRLAGDPSHARAWGLLSVTAVLMLIEDAGDPRHQLAEYLPAFFPDGSTAGSLAAVGGEALVFGLLGAAALAAAWWFPSLRRHRLVLGLLLGGYACYALAGFSSFGSAIQSDGVGIYHVVGGWIDETLLGGRLFRHGDHTGFWLMDRVYEETVELAGATLLCAAVMAYRAVDPTAAGRGVRSPRGPVPPPE